MTTASIPCVRNGSVGEDMNINRLIDNLPDASSASTSTENAPKTNVALWDIHQDLDSFTFGLSELSLLADVQSEIGRRIILLKICLENAKTKVDKLMKLNEPVNPI